MPPTLDGKILGNKKGLKMKKYISPALLILAAAIWGFAFSMQKSAEGVPPFTLGALRSIIAAVFLFAVIPFSSKLSDTGADVSAKSRPLFTKVELIGGLLCGAVLATATFFQQAGIASGVDAGKASFITSLYVIFVPVYYLFLKRRAPVNIWISIVIAAVGFYLLCINGSFGISSEDLTVLVCSLLFPLHIMFIDHYVKTCDPIRLSIVQFLSGAVINLIFALIFDPAPSMSVILPALPAIIYLGIMSSGVAYTLQMIGQKGTAPWAATIILSLESVFGVLGGALLLGEVLSVREYVGCAVIFVAVLLSQLDFTSIVKKSK